MAAAAQARPHPPRGKIKAMVLEDDEPAKPARGKPRGAHLDVYAYAIAAFGSRAS